MHKLVTTDKSFDTLRCSSFLERYLACIILFMDMAVK